MAGGCAGLVGLVIAVVFLLGILWLGGFLVVNGVSSLRTPDHEATFTVTGTGFKEDPYCVGQLSVHGDPLPGVYTLSNCDRRTQTIQVRYRDGDESVYAASHGPVVRDVVLIVFGALILGGFLWLVVWWCIRARRQRRRPG